MSSVEFDWYNPHLYKYLRPEKRFEANALEFFMITISQNCPEKTLTFNFLCFCGSALKTKNSLEVHFRKKMNCTEILLLLPHRKKTF